MRASDPPDALLVRLAVRGDRWAEDIPPPPKGFDVTVSFAGDEAADLHGDALALLGYVVVDAPLAALAAAPAAIADFLVPRTLAAAHPTWWRALLERAEHVYDLCYGPAAATMADVVRAHAVRR